MIYFFKGATLFSFLFIITSCSNKPINIKFNSQVPAIYDENENTIQYLEIMKFDNDGNFKGEMFYSHITDSPTCTKVFLLKENKYYTNYTNIPMIFEKGYNYKVNAAALGSVDSLNFHY